MNRKLTFLIGSLIGSTIGILFARESGKDLRTRLLKAGTPQAKFEILFQEYMKLGKDAFKTLESSDVTKDLVQGGKDIVRELKRRADTDGGRALKIAHEKALELLTEAERRMHPVIETVAKQARGVAKSMRADAKKAGNGMKKAVAKEEKVVKEKVRKAAAKVKKTAKKIAGKARA